jgi:hypothetical protein
MFGRGGAEWLPEGRVGTRRGGDPAQFAGAPYQSVPQRPRRESFRSPAQAPEAGARGLDPAQIAKSSSSSAPWLSLQKS